MIYGCRIGLLGMWDVVAFDEVAGLEMSDSTVINMLKDYMESGSFARGKEVTEAALDRLAKRTAGSRAKLDALDPPAAANACNRATPSTAGKAPSGKPSR